MGPPPWFCWADHRAPNSLWLPEPDHSHAAGGPGNSECSGLQTVWPKWESGLAERKLRYQGGRLALGRRQWWGWLSHGALHFCRSWSWKWNPGGTGSRERASKHACGQVEILAALLLRPRCSVTFLGGGNRGSWPARPFARRFRESAPVLKLTRLISNLSMHWAV